MPFDEEELDPHGECAAEISRLRALVEEAYREGFSHGEDAACAYEWGAATDQYKTWEHSEAKAALVRTDAESQGD